jgi:hypothetical protein
VVNALRVVRHSLFSFADTAWSKMFFFEVPQIVPFTKKELYYSQRYFVGTVFLTLVSFVLSFGYYKFYDLEKVTMTYTGYISSADESNSSIVLNLQTMYIRDSNFDGLNFIEDAHGARMDWVGRWEPFPILTSIGTAISEEWTGCQFCPHFAPFLKPDVDCLIELPANPVKIDVWYANFDGEYLTYRLLHSGHKVEVRTLWRLGNVSIWNFDLPSQKFVLSTVGSKETSFKFTWANTLIGTDGVCEVCASNCSAERRMGRSQPDGDSILTDCLDRVWSASIKSVVMLDYFYLSLGEKVFDLVDPISDCGAQYDVVNQSWTVDATATNILDCPSFNWAANLSHVQNGSVYFHSLCRSAFEEILAHDQVVSFTEYLKSNDLITSLSAALPIASSVWSGLSVLFIFLLHRDLDHFKELAAAEAKAMKQKKQAATKAAEAKSMKQKKQAATKAAEDGDLSVTWRPSAMPLTRIIANNKTALEQEQCSLQRMTLEIHSLRAAVNAMEQRMAEVDIDFHKRIYTHKDRLPQRNRQVPVEDIKSEARNPVRRLHESKPPSKQPDSQNFHSVNKTSNSRKKSSETSRRDRKRHTISVHLRGPCVTTPETDKLSPQKHSHHGDSTDTATHSTTKAPKHSSKI